MGEKKLHGYISHDRVTHPHRKFHDVTRSNEIWNGANRTYDEEVTNI